MEMDWEGDGWFFSPKNLLRPVKKVNEYERSNDYIKLRVLEPYVFYIITVLIAILIPISSAAEMVTFDCD